MVIFSDSSVSISSGKLEDSDNLVSYSNQQEVRDKVQ